MDCKRAAPTSSPWVSLNTATKICIECSGVHRGLGSHISKVRSLLLDDLHEAEYRFLLHMLVDCDVNASVWEGNVSGVPPATAQGNSDFIRAKYMSKRFMRRVVHDGSGSSSSSRGADQARELEEAIMAAVRAKDCCAVMLCLNQGAGNFNEVLRVACECDSLHIVVLIALNASDLDAQAAITTATSLGRTDIREYLCDKFALN
jgi:hypothetical protein